MIRFKQFVEKYNSELYEEEAWHGSPHLFDKFTRKNTAHTGEGGAAYGSGIYVTNNRSVANYYRDANKDSTTKTAYQLKLSLDKDKLMHWHKKVDEQTPFVQNALKRVAADFDWSNNPNPDARHIFHHIRKTYKAGGANNIESSESASRALQNVGIHGIEYHGDFDNKTNEKPVNKVIFDPKRIKITKKYDENDEERQDTYKQ